MSPDAAAFQPHLLIRLFYTPPFSSSSHLAHLLRLNPLKRLTPRRTIFHINLRIRLGLLLIHSSALDEHNSWHGFDIRDHDCGAFAAVFVVHALAGVAGSGEEEVGAGELFELYRMKRLVYRRREGS